MRFVPAFLFPLLCLSFLLASLATPESAWAEVTWTWEHPLPAGDAVNDVCSPAPGIAFAVGPFGKILRRTASGWEKLDSPVIKDLNAVWAWSATDMVAVGDQGTILLYNGTTFTQLDASIPVDVTGVWGTSNKKFWITATSAIFYYNGVSWTGVYAAPDIQTFNDIHGSSATDIYAVGDWGAFVHYDGATWGDTTPAHPWASPYAMNSVWAMDTGEVFVVGDGGASYIFDPSGPSWTDRSGDSYPLSSEALSCVWGTSATNVYTGFYNLYHYAGSQWTQIATAESIYKLSGINGSSSTEIFITTEQGDLVNYNGAAMNNELDNAKWAFNAIWCPPGGQPLGCGYSQNDADFDGALFVRSDSGWGATIVSELDMDNIEYLSVWGRSASDAYAVGVKDDSSNYWAAAAHYDGATWSTLNPNLIDTELGAVWCATGTNVIAVGENLDGGAIYEYTGSAWNDVTPATSPPAFRCVWGSGPSDIWAGGVGGSLYHYGGTAWEAVTDSGASDNILNIWGTSASNVYLAAGNFVYHFDGSTWTNPYTCPIALQGLYGFSANDIWCTANYNELSHYDGTSWQLADEHFASFGQPFGMCGTSNKFWFLDGNGGVLRRDAPASGAPNLVPARSLLLSN